MNRPMTNPRNPPISINAPIMPDISLGLEAAIIITTPIIIENEDRIFSPLPDLGGFASATASTVVSLVCVGAPHRGQDVARSET